MFLIKNLELPNKITINFSMKENSALHLIGKNGSGKSLFLTSLARLIASTYDQFEYLGQDTTHMNLIQYHSEVMYLPAHTQSNHEKSTFDFFTEPLKFKIHSHKVLNKDILSILEKFSWWNKKFDRLSTGEKQFLSFMRIIQLNPRVLLIDEGLTNLDQEKITLVDQVLTSWKNTTQGSFILVDHHQDVAKQLRTKDVCFTDLISR